MAYGTVSADIVQSSVSGVSLGAGNATLMKNRFINGAFNVNQYNLGTVTPTANQYIIDRWLSNVSVASKFSVAQSSVAPAGFTNSALITSTSAYTVASSDYETFQQRIEANNMLDMGWGTANAKTVTLSFWVNCSLTGTFGGSIYFPASTTRSYPFSYTISAANTWQQIAITIPGDTVTNTAPTGTNLYCIVQWALGVGSTYTTTAGSWVNGNYASSTGATNLIATNGATFYLTGVQLEVGSSATGFEYRQYGQEFALCQRYLPAFNSVGAANQVEMITTGWVSNGASTAQFIFNYIVAPRVRPTGLTCINYNSFQINAAVGGGLASSVTFLDASTAGARFQVGQSGMTTGQACQLYYDNTTSAVGQLLFTGCEL